MIELKSHGLKHLHVPKTCLSTKMKIFTVGETQRRRNVEVALIATNNIDTMMSIGH